MKKEKKWILLLLLVWLVGCSTSSEDKFLNYLKEKYNEEFEIETMQKGSTFFANMYGKDRVVAHPKGDPETVFRAHESKTEDGVYRDDYIAAVWGEELKRDLAEEIEKHIPNGSEYKVSVEPYSADFDNASLTEKSIHDFLEKNKDTRISLVVGIKTEGEPDVSQYSEGIYELYKLVKSFGTSQHVISVGFVDHSEDIYDYIRTSDVNNIPWSNLALKVYGSINVNNRFDSVNQQLVEESYMSSEDY